MWHVPAAEFAFCLGDECLRCNDFLEEQSTEQFSVFHRQRGSSLGERSWQPTAAMSPRGCIQVFWEHDPWNPTAKAVRLIKLEASLSSQPHCSTPWAPLSSENCPPQGFCHPCCWHTAHDPQLASLTEDFWKRALKGLGSMGWEGNKWEAQEGVRFGWITASSSQCLSNQSSVQRTEFTQGFSSLALLFLFPPHFPRNRTWHLFLWTAGSYGYSPATE